MKHYKLKILPAAQQDMQEIADYVKTLSPDAALRLYDDIVEGIEFLAEIPMRCALLKTPELRIKGYRGLHVKNYIVFFVILDDTVQIRRILYAKRQFKFLF